MSVDNVVIPGETLDVGEEGSAENKKIVLGDGLRWKQLFDGLQIPIILLF